MGEGTRCTLISSVQTIQITTAPGFHTYIYTMYVYSINASSIFVKRKYTPPVCVGLKIYFVAIHLRKLCAHDTSIARIYCACPHHQGFLFFFFSHTSFFFPAFGQAVVTGVVPFPPRCLPSIFIAHRRVQQSHCSSISHRMLLTHSRSRAFRKAILCTQERSPNEFIRDCTRGDSNSRN